MKKTIINGYTTLICVMLAFLLVGCGEKKNSATLLSDTMEEVNKKDSGFDNFKVYNNPEYFAIVYQLENTPENKAKILWMGNRESLGQKFRAEVLKRLKKGDILARVVKEGKALVMAVQSDEIEYRVVYTPAEIVSEIFKQ